MISAILLTCLLQFDSAGENPYGSTGHAKAAEPTSIVLVTLKTCRPCQQCKSQTLPALAKRGWIVRDYSTGCAANVWVLDAEDDQAAKFGVGLVPTWCVCRGNRVVKRYVGYMTADEVARAWREAK